MGFKLFCRNLSSQPLLGDRGFHPRETMKSIILEVLNNKLFSFSLADIDEMYAVKDADDHQMVELKLIAETIRGINE